MLFFGGSQTTTEEEHSGSKRLGKYIKTFQCAELLSGTWALTLSPNNFSFRILGHEIGIFYLQDGVGLAVHVYPPFCG